MLSRRRTLEILLDHVRAPRDRGATCGIGNRSQRKHERRKFYAKWSDVVDVARDAAMVDRVADAVLILTSIGVDLNPQGRDWWLWIALEIVGMEQIGVEMTSARAKRTLLRVESEYFAVTTSENFNSDHWRFVTGLRFESCGANVATVAHVYIDNGFGRMLFGEIGLPATTGQFGRATVIDMPIDLTLPEGYWLSVSLSRTVRSGWFVEPSPGSGQRHRRRHAQDRLLRDDLLTVPRA